MYSIQAKISSEPGTVSGQGRPNPREHQVGRPRRPCRSELGVILAPSRATTAALPFRVILQVARAARRGVMQTRIETRTRIWARTVPTRSWGLAGSALTRTVPYRPGNHSDSAQVTSLRALGRGSACASSESNCPTLPTLAAAAPPHFLSGIDWGRGPCRQPRDTSRRRIGATRSDSDRLGVE
jgi:hypothetical protein